jgi:hypothetical protein
VTLLSFTTTQRKDMGINRIYTVYNKSDIDNVPIQKIANYIRYSLDGTQLIVEWTNTPPDDAVVINHDTAISIMSNTNWTPLEERLSR